MQVKSPRWSEGVAVRHVSGGPIMTVQGDVGHLLLCTWLDDVGRVHRRTFSPNEVALYDPGHTVWLRVLARLASRGTVAATW